MKNNLSAKKSLGQNFLKSKKALKKIVEVVHLSKDDIVIEIGPGKGALTEEILKSGAKLIAFELDERMIEFLEEKFSSFIKKGQFQIIHKDVLDIDMDDFFGNLGKYKLVANIPYYITSPILRHFLYNIENKPEKMLILMQKDV